MAQYFRYSEAHFTPKWKAVAVPKMEGVYGYIHSQAAWQPNRYILDDRKAGRKEKYQPAVHRAGNTALVHSKHDDSLALIARSHQVVRTFRRNLKNSQDDHAAAPQRRLLLP